MTTWPSIQKDSEILRQRIAWAKRAELTREQLIYLLERIKKEAA